MPSIHVLSSTRHWIHTHFKSILSKRSVFENKYSSSIVYDVHASQSQIKRWNPQGKCKYALVQMHIRCRETDICFAFFLHLLFVYPQHNIISVTKLRSGTDIGWQQRLTQSVFGGNELHHIKKCFQFSPHSVNRDWQNIRNTFQYSAV